MDPIFKIEVPASHVMLYLELLANTPLPMGRNIEKLAVLQQQIEINRQRIEAEARGAVIAEYEARKHETSAAPAEALPVIEVRE